MDGAPVTMMVPATDAKPGRPATFGASAIYVVLPLAFSVVTLPLVSEAMRPPLDPANRLSTALTLLAVFVVGVLLPATALLPGLSSLVRPVARVLLAGTTFVFTVIWGTIVAWAIGFGTSGGNGAVLGSAIGTISTWVLTTSSAWPVMISAICMALPRGRARRFALAASIGGGMLILILALIATQV